MALPAFASLCQPLPSLTHLFVYMISDTWPHMLGHGHLCAEDVAALGWAGVTAVAVKLVMQSNVCLYSIWHG